MRTEKMRIDNMEKVFKAAMTLFSKQNVTNTTLQMIADEAGVSTRSIVNYFNTRENLLLATHQRYIEYAFAELKKFCETEEYQKLSGREQVLAFTRHILEFVPKYYNHIYAMKEIVIAVAATGIASDERFINECVMSLSMPVIESMKKGMKDGSVNLPNGLNENNVKMFLVVLRGVFEEYAEILKSKNEEAIKTVSSAIETLYAYLDAILKGIIKE